MSEEVVKDMNISIESIDPEVIINLYELKCDAIEAIVDYYSQIFSKVFKKLIESSEPEEKQKLEKIKEMHLNEYKSLIDKRLDQQMQQFFNNSENTSKLIYLSNNMLTDSLVEVPKAVQPFKLQFMSDLKQFQEKVNTEYQMKHKLYNELHNNSNNAFKTYNECRKALKKKVYHILNELESIDLEDLV